MAFRYKNRADLTKEQAAKRNYFDMFGRHFTHIIEVSILYALVNLLFWGASFILFVIYFSGGNFENALLALFTGKIYVFPFLPFIPLMLTGPFTAGFTYVIRNYAKQEHAFIVSDFFEHTKKNLKQGLLASITGYGLMYLIIQALFVYKALVNASGIVFGIFTIVSVLLTIMSFYVFPIMVTFKLKFKDIVKNSWIFTLIKLPQNLFIFAIIFLVNALPFYFLVYTKPLIVIYVALFMLILTGFTSFTANYYIWNVLDKYMMSKVKTEKKMKYKAAIFDLDGTLLDSIGDLANAMNETLLSYGFCAYQLPYHKSAVGNGIRAYAEKCIPESKNTPEFLDEFVKSVGERYDKSCTVTTRPFDEICELLNFLKDNNISLNVLSNKLDGFAKEMIKYYFDDYGFDCVLGERPDVPKKPDPTAAFEIAESLGVKPDEVIFIGDSIFDVLTGKNAGMLSIGAAWGYQSEEMLLEKEPDFLAHKPSDIINYLKTL